MNNMLLSEKFLDVVKRIGMDELKLPVFYNASVAIRFEIGNPHIKRDSKYIDDAFSRARTVYHSMPNEPDIMRVDLYVDYEDNYHNDVLLQLNSIGVPAPDEKKIVKHFDNEYLSCNEDGGYEILECYWDLSINSDFVDELLYSIVISEIISEKCNTPDLPSSVYFANTKEAMLFWLYDDRGADLAAASKEILLPIYYKYNDWIFDYDRERIDGIFAD